MKGLSVAGSQSWRARSSDRQPAAAGSQRTYLTAILPVREYEEGVNVFMAAASGTVKKTALTGIQPSAFAGSIAVNLNDGDRLIGVDLTSGS